MPGVRGLRLGSPVRVRSVDEQVVLPRETVLRWARLLEVIVVSGNRIGSCHAKPLDELHRQFGRWFLETDLWRELSRLGGDVYEILRGPTPTDDEALAAELGPLPYWEPADRR
jgi:hypothetical protein